MKRKIEELPPVSYENQLLERKIEIERVIKSKEKALERTKNLESAGHIRIVPHRSVLQYYLITKKGDTRGKYLPRSQNEFAESLITFDYNKKALKALKSELNQINKLLAFCKKHSVQTVYSGFSKYKKSLLEPVTLEAKDFVQQWKTVSYSPKNFDYSSTEYYTSKGERVRSKSEVIIADTLSRFNVPYRYEYPLELKSRSFPIYPDFCCLNLSTRKEYYWEHFGMMDDSEYAAKATAKINAMASDGFFSGKNALFTFETTTTPLNVKTLEKIIEAYLL